MDTNGLVTIDFAKQKARFMKIEIKNIGTIPDGEPDEGNAGWLFVDELSVY